MYGSHGYSITTMMEGLGMGDDVLDKVSPTIQRAEGKGLRIVRVIHSDMDVPL